RVRKTISRKEGGPHLPLLRAAAAGAHPRGLVLLPLLRRALPGAQGRRLRPSRLARLGPRRGRGTAEQTPRAALRLSVRGTCSRRRLLARLGGGAGRGSPA